MPSKVTFSGLFLISSAMTVAARPGLTKLRSASSKSKPAMPVLPCTDAALIIGATNG